MATISSNVIRVKGSAVVEVIAYNYAEQVTPPAAIVETFAYGNARVDGQLNLRGTALVEVIASGETPAAHTGIAGQAVVAAYARGNARVDGEVRPRTKPAVVELYGRGIVAETWQFFAPLTSVGSEGSYAQGTATIGLTAAGEGGQLGEDNYAEGSANLPLLSSGAFGLTGGLGQGDGDFQPLTSIGSEGSYAQASVSLAPLKSIAFEPMDYAVALLEQPPSVLRASGWQFRAEADLEQPPGELTGYFGGVAHFTEPHYEVTLDGDFPIVGRATLEQPRSTLDASGLSGSVGKARLTHPRSQLEGRDGWCLSMVQPGHGFVVEATFGEVGRAELSQPRSILTARGGEANYGRAILEQPASVLVPAGILIVEQPTTHLVASGGELVDAPVYLAYAVNLAHAGITSYSNYPFRRIVEFNGEYFGVGPQGIFRLDGSTDAGTAIASVLETARPDFGNALDKRATYAYAMIDTTDTIDVTPVSSEAVGTTRQALGSNRSGMHNRRVKFGKGTKARAWGVRLEHAGEDRYTLRDIELLGDVLRRKAGG